MKIRTHHRPGLGFRPQIEVDFERSSHRHYSSDFSNHLRDGLGEQQQRAGCPEVACRSSTRRLLLIEHCESLGWPPALADGKGSSLGGR